MTEVPLSKPVPVSLGIRRPGQTADVVRVPWREFAAQAPVFAAEVKARFGQQDRHILATLTFAGAQRVSGVQVDWEGADAVIRVPTGSGRATDLLSDPRFVVHSNPGDGSGRDGDIKLTGSVITGTPAGSGDAQTVFHLQLERVIRATTLDTGHVEVLDWQPDQAVRSTRHERNNHHR